MAKKAKKNAKKGKGKRAKAQRGGRKGGGGGMSGIMSYAMGVCSVTNPFCPEAIGSRWPDNSYTRSVGWSAPGFPSDVGTDANGYGSRLFLADNFQVVQASSITWPTITYNANGAFVFTLPSGVSRYRITSWGLKLSCPWLTPMSASGLVSVRLFSPLGGASLGTVLGNTILADSSMDIPLASLVNKSVFVIPMPLGENARLFRDINAVTAVMVNWVNPGWQVVQIAVSGAPVSASVVHVEMYYHYELVFNDGDASTSFAQPPPTENVAIQRGNGNVLASIGNFVEGSLSKVDSLFQSKAFKYLSAAAAGAYAGPSAAAGVFGAIGNGQSSTRMIMDVD
jgi:hypothetical protein